MLGGNSVFPIGRALPNSLSLPLSTSSLSFSVHKLKCPPQGQVVSSEVVRLSRDLSKSRLSWSLQVRQVPGILIPKNSPLEESSKEKCLKYEQQSKRGQTMDLLTLAQLIFSCAPMVSLSLMQGIVLQESGGNPYAINDGPSCQALFPKSYEQAVATATKLPKRGHRINAGLA